MDKAALEDLNKKLARRASRAIIGGFRPPDDPLTSWFGKVNIALPGEDWPTSAARPMMALCQFNLTEVPFRPENLHDVASLIVLTEWKEFPNGTPNGDGWLLRSTLRSFLPSMKHRGSFLFEQADEGWKRQVRFQGWWLRGRRVDPFSFGRLLPDWSRSNFRSRSTRGGRSD